MTFIWLWIFTDISFECHQWNQHLIKTTKSSATLFQYVLSFHFRRYLHVGDFGWHFQNSDYWYVCTVRHLKRTKKEWNNLVILRTPFSQLKRHLYHSHLTLMNMTANKNYLDLRMSLALHLLCNVVLIILIPHMTHFYWALTIMKMSAATKMNYWAWNSLNKLRTFAEK